MHDLHCHTNLSACAKRESTLSVMLGALKAAGVKYVVAKSFARIHETNLKKQGVLALVFRNPADYELVREGDTFDIYCSGIAPGKDIEVVARHADGSSDSFNMAHTYNAQQLAWFKAGSALNSLKDGTS